MLYELPVNYDELTPKQRKEVREQYIAEQKWKCWFCGKHLEDEPHHAVVEKKINWELFPVGFMRHPIHLQHDHETGMTEGAVHAMCNAVLWQYHGR